MDRKLQEKLFNKYPDLFKDKDKSMRETCMCWGIEVGDGWYNLLDVACHHLNHEVQQEKSRVLKMKSLPLLGKIKKLVYKLRRAYIDWRRDCFVEYEESFQFSQVKEKYGTLRISQWCSTDSMDAISSIVEDLSEYICDVCGNKGRIDDESSWLSSRCDEHR